MGIDHSLRFVGRFSEQVERDQVSGLLTPMAKLARIGGKLPVSKELQGEIRSALQQDNFRVEEIPHALCQDVLVPLRFLALANQAFYSRGKAVTDLGVIGSMIGVSRVAEKFEELGRVESLKNAFRGRALAASAYQNAVLSSLFAQRFYTCIEKERFPTVLPFMTTAAIELPFVLLAYLRPSLYAACLLDSCVEENTTMDRFFKKMFSKSIPQFFEGLAEEMGIPKAFSDFVDMLTMAPWNRRGWTIAATKQNRSVVTAAYVSQKLGALVPRFIDRQDFYNAVRAFDGRGELNKHILDNALVNISSRFLKAMKHIGLPALRLPQYFEIYEDQIVDEKGGISDVEIPWPPISQRLDPFVTELKACLNATAKEGEFPRLPQALATTMLAMTRGLHFDRVVLFTDENTENGRMLVPKLTFGRAFDPELVLKPLSDWDGYAPHKSAMEQEQAVFLGDPLIGDDWPFVAFPLMQRNTVRAILYADKRKEKNAPGLSTEEQVACIALAEVWHEVPEKFE